MIRNSYKVVVIIVIINGNMFVLNLLNIFFKSFDGILEEESIILYKWIVWGFIIEGLFKL